MSKKIEALFKASGELSPREDLKGEILSRVGSECEIKGVAQKRKKSSFGFAKKWIPLTACLLLMILISGTAVGIGVEEYQTVYVDVNPSVELSVNRLGIVNGVEYINEDAESSLKDVKIKGKSAENALEAIINAYDENGYFDENAELYVSASGKKDKSTDKLLEKLEKKAEQVKGNKKYTVNTVKLTEQERDEARASGISAGKYKVICEIIEKDSDYTVDELKDMSMSELKKLQKGKVK